MKTIKVLPQGRALDEENKKSTSIHVRTLLVPVPQVTVTIRDVPTPQHLEQIVEQGMSQNRLSRTRSLIVCDWLIPQERILLHSVEEVGDVLVLQMQEQIGVLRRIVSN